MHLHLTSPQLLVGAFALALGIIFALSAIVQFRLQRARPFRNYYCSEFDRNLFPEKAFCDDEGFRPDRHTRFQGIDQPASPPPTVN